MNAKDFLIAHGEKIAVAAIAGFCLWQIVDVSTSHEIRADDSLRQEALKREWDEIERTSQSSPPPTLLPPRDFLGQMKARFAAPIAAQPAMPWLTAHPDLPPTDPDRLFLYAYEVLAPTISATDNVGSLRLDIGLPEAIRPADRRHSDARAVTWNRRDRSGQIVNSAGILGVIVEVKVGGGAVWQPVPADGRLIQAGGFIPLDRLQAAGYRFNIDILEPWSEHRFQARLAVRATGLPPEPTPQQLDRDSPITSTVMVWRGRFTQPGDDNIVWPVQVASLRKDPAKYLAGAILPTKPPAWAKLGQGEQLYLGPESPIATVLATDDVRFALDKVVPGSSPVVVANPEDPNQAPAPQPAADPAVGAVAHILVTRRLPDPRGGAARWTAPTVFRVKVGEPVGGKGVAVADPFDPGNKILVDLTTPFVVQSADFTSKRLVYWFVRTKARPAGGGQRDIELKEQQRSARSIVLRNAKTGNIIPLVQLDTIPAVPAGQIVWPWQFMEGVDERARFLADPAGFRSFGKEPPAPAAYAPGTGPLVELARGNPDLRQVNTDTTYYQFGDDRIIWWDHVNRREKWFPDQPAVAAKPAADKPPADARPAKPATP